MSEPLILAEGVSKKLCRDMRRSLWYGLKDLAADIGADGGAGRDRLRPSEFWAVRDVWFSVRRGECLGLVGRNGAGKTTLLRMLNGLLRPDTGRIAMRGNVGAMIALGAGVKEVLSGRENILLLASLRGMGRRDVARKIDAIIEFAEIRDAIDAPVQTYSSGMRVRLNFAVASALEPDVLLLDEVLAVGDAAFRNKCYHRIAELRRNTAVVFVSHSMEQIARTCTQALVMHQGQVVCAGSVEEGVRVYQELNVDATGRPGDAFLSLHPPVEAFAATPCASEIRSGDPLDVDLDVRCNNSPGDCLVKVLFYNATGAFAADGCVALAHAGHALATGDNRLRVRIGSLPLNNGVYTIAINIIDSAGDLVVWSYKMHDIRVTGAYVGGIADCQLHLDVGHAA